MRRIFWDTMLFIYLLENRWPHADRVQYLLEQSYEKNDQLITSC